MSHAHQSRSSAGKHQAWSGRVEGYGVGQVGAGACACWHRAGNRAPCTPRRSRQRGNPAQGAAPPGCSHALGAWAGRRRPLTRP